MASLSAIGNDKAIEFQAVLLKAKNIIKRMQDIGFNVTSYLECLKNIEEEINNENKENIQSGNANFSGFLINTYTRGISKVEEVINELSKYDVYCDINSFTNQLTNALKSNCIDDSNRNVYVSKIIYNLKLLSNSSTLYYQAESFVVENYYKAVYDFIKYEIKTYGNSRLLDLGLNGIDIVFLSEEVLKDIENIDLSDKKCRYLKRLLQELNKGNNGIEYLNESIVRAIVAINIGEDKIDEELDKIDKKINYSKKDVEERLENNEKTIEIISNSRTRKRAILKSKKVVLAGVSLIAYLTTFITGITMGVKSARSKTYKILNESYSTVDGILPSYYTESSIGKDSIILSKFGEYYRDDTDKYVFDYETYEVPYSYNYLSDIIKNPTDFELIDKGTSEVDIEVSDAYESGYDLIERKTVKGERENFEIKTLLGYLTLTIYIMYLITKIIDIFSGLENSLEELKTLYKEYDNINIILNKLNSDYKDRLKEIKNIYLELKYMYENNPYLKLVKDNPDYQENISEIDKNYQRVISFIRNEGK